MRGRTLAAMLLLLGLLAVTAGTPASGSSFDKLREIVEKAIERLGDFERRIKERSDSASEVIVRIVRKGFEYFAKSSTVARVRGLRRHFYDRFVDMTLRRLRVPEEDVEEIRAKVFNELRDNAEAGRWLVHKLLYNPQDDPSGTKYLSVLGYRHSDDSFDIVTLEMQARIEFARNLLIIQNKDTGDLSVETEEVETERLPGGVDRNDARLLMNFLEASALRALRSQL